MRTASRTLAGVLAVAILAGCAGARIPRAPAPEDEVARLKRDVVKVRFAIDATKELIERSRGQPYLPDLYLRLAELYVEEARYHYFIAYEGQKRREKAVTSVQARLLKDQAIAVYKRILQEFPGFKDEDKVLFFIAHEYREMGEYEQMLEYLQQIADKHEKSPFRNEALLVMGDYYFDKSDLATAERHYKMILATPESPSHGMARYKLAWVRINQEDYKGAASLFEDTIRGMVSNDAPIASSRKIDLRREALVDLVFPYTEVNKKPDADRTLAHFRELADTRTSYLAALSKLANRWFVKAEYQLAGAVYRELLTVGSDSDDSVEWAQRLYDGAVKGKQFDHVAHDVDLLTAVLSRRYYDWRLGDKERDALYKEFEAYCRDLATKAQAEAQAKSNDDLMTRSADAYERYLAFFDEAPKAQEIRLNMAEARFAAKQWLKAGRAYDDALPKIAKEDRRDGLYTAVVAYGKALTDDSRALSRLDLVQARAGLRRSARSFIGEFPKDKDTALVKFNLAKSYYDEGLFEDASEMFAALVNEFPTASESSIAAELALDSLRAMEDFEGLAGLGKALASDPRLPAALRSDIQAIVSSAESRALDQATLEAGAEGEGAAQSLVDFALARKGTALGEKALLNAFATARNTDDLDKVAEIGDMLLAAFPTSDKIPDVLATLGKMAAAAVDFERSARYLEEAARRKPNDPTSIAALQVAAAIKANLGDVPGAKTAYDQVLSRSKGQARRDPALALADLLERTGDHAGAARALDAALAAGADSAQVHYRLGYAHRRTGDSVGASRHFADAVKAGARSNDPLEVDAAAGAQYFLVQDAVAAYRGVPSSSDVVTSIKTKYAALAEVENGLVGVIQLGSARWAIAALSELSQTYADGAAFLRGLPLPAGDAGAAQLKAAIDQRAGELDGKAKEAMSTCGDKAAELKVFTPAAQACVAGRVFDQDPGARPPLPARRAAGALPPEALQLRKAIARNSKDYDALGKLAVIYLKAGDPLGAQLILDKAAEGGADSATYNLRGVVAYAVGAPQAAYEEFKAALDRDGSNSRARLNLAALFRSAGFARLAESEASRVRSTAGIEAGDPALIPGAVTTGVK
jgi:tetratricopeptide (TPR) repeat protein